MSFLEEAIALQRVAHDLMYLGTDGSPIYSDDLSRRNSEVYRLTTTLYNSGTWGATDAPLWHHPLKEQMPWLDTAYRAATGKDPTVEYPDYEPCHRLYMQHGVCTVENAGGDIDEVTGKRMIIAAFPFRCEMADGGFVRLVAWEPGNF